MSKAGAEGARSAGGAEGRASDRPSRRIGRSDAAACAVVSALVLLAFFEIAFLGRTFSTSATTGGVNGGSPPTGYGSTGGADLYRIDPGASAWVFEPWAEVTSEALARGQLPLWNPYQGAGTPLAAAMQGAVFDPLLMLVRISPSPLTWDLSFLLAFLLGALATYAFCRLLGLGPPASVTGSAIFVLSGWFLMYSNNHFFRSYMYLPVLCALVEAVVRSRGLLPVLGLGAAIAGNLFVGMPEASFLVLLTAAFFGAFRAFSGRRVGTALQVLLRLGAGASFGVALSAPLLLLFAEYLTFAFNTHQRGIPGVQADAPRQLLLWLFPLIDGLPARGRGGTWTGVRNWSGAGAALLAVTAIASPASMRRHRGWFFLAWAAVLLLKIYGFPALAWVGTAPIAKLTLYPVFASPVAGFSLAVVAAIGVQAVEAREVRKPILFPMLGTLALILAGLFGSHLRLFANGISPFAWSQIGIATRAAALILAAALLPRRRLAPWLAGIAVVTELMAFVPHGIYARRYEPYVEPPWIAPIRRGLESKPLTRVYGLDGLLYPNTAGALRLQDVRTLDAIYPSRYLSFIRAFVEPEFDDRWVGAPPDEPTPANIEGNRMFDLLGVGYVVTGGHDLRPSFLGGFFRDQSPNPLLHPTQFDIGGDVRPVLLEHSPQEVEYPLSEPPPTAISFAYAIHPEAWTDPGADGVVFALEAVGADGSRLPLWRESYIPRIDPVAPEWRSASVDLTSLPLVPRSLLFRTEMRGNPSTDWAGWADVRLSTTGSAASQYRRVGGAAGVTVFENTRRIPRAFVVEKVHVVSSPEEAVGLVARTGSRFDDGAIRAEGFDPAREAVVEGPPGALHRLTGAPAGRPAARVHILSYTPNEVVVSVDAARPGLLVLTDVYVPGWRATVNGRPSEVLAADIAFRGVAVGSGRSEVIFRYRPRGLRVGGAIAASGVLVAAGAALSRRRASRSIAVRP